MLNNLKIFLLKYFSTVFVQPITGMQMGLYRGQDLALQTRFVRDLISFSWVTKHTLYRIFVALHLYTVAE